MLNFVKGDTPTITITIDGIDDISAYDDVYIVLKQARTLITRHKSDVTIKDNKIIMALKTSETMALNGEMNIEIQATFINGQSRLTSDIAEGKVMRLLDGGDIDGGNS